MLEASVEDASGQPDASHDPRDPAERNHPADLLNLRSWKVTVPIDTEHAGSPDEYKNPELRTLTVSPYFALTPEKDGVIFRAHAGGATTVSSSYPRSELREMTSDGIDLAAWSTFSGTHRMKVRQAITHLPPVKPHVVSAQIHDSDDDVVMIRLEGEHLYVESNGERLSTLESSYSLGTAFTVEFVAANGRIEVFYNGVMAASLEKAASGCYYKAGCYTQTNVERGDAPDDFAQVVIYDLELRHEP